MTNDHKGLLKKISPRLALGYILYDFFSPVGWLANILALVSLGASFYFIWKGVRNTKSDTTYKALNINSVMLVLFALVIFFGSPNERSILGKNFQQIKKAQVFFNLVSEFKNDSNPDESIETHCFDYPTPEGMHLYQYCNISFSQNEITIVKDVSSVPDAEMFKSMFNFNKSRVDGFVGNYKDEKFYISGFESLGKFQCMKRLKMIHELYIIKHFKMRDIILDSKNGSFCEFKILEDGKYSALVGAIEIKK